MARRRDNKPITEMTKKQTTTMMGRLVVPRATPMNYASEYSTLEA